MSLTAKLRARALCSEQRWESGSPFLQGPDTPLLAGVRPMEVSAAHPGRGVTAVPQGNVPRSAPHTSRGTEAGSSGRFHAGEQLEKDLWSSVRVPGHQLPTEAFSEVPAQVWPRQIPLLLAIFTDDSSGTNRTCCCNLSWVVFYWAVTIK